MSIAVIDHDSIIERELALVRDQVGADFPGYRNHVYRVLTYALHFLGGDQQWRAPIAFALAHHDVGLWTQRALAYLEPSEAHAELARQARAPNLAPRRQPLAAARLVPDRGTPAPLPRPSARSATQARSCRRARRS